MSSSQTCVATLTITTLQFTGTLDQCEDWVANLIGQPVFILSYDGDMVEAGIVQGARTDAVSVEE